MTTTALLLAALIAAPQPGPAERVPDAVLAEMAPAPGHWEVEDAPAYFSARTYFSDRTAITDAPAPEEAAADGAAAGAREGEALVARRHP
jgi:hypothetical protein